MLILKIPIVYLGVVVWYACKEPEGPRPRRGGPHGHRDGRVRVARRDRVPS